MTIFLTTQYLEEADALAHRVGIIDRGRLVAEGSPDALKHSVGQDVIVAEVTGSDHRALARLRNVPGVDDVTMDSGRITISTSNGSGALSPIALSLGRGNVAVSSLTLRTPTLDDVFEALTGSHIESVDQ